MLRHVVKECCRNVYRSTSRGFSTTTCKQQSLKVQGAEELQELVKNSKVPVIVDFFATWCSPCRMLTPRLESVIEEKKGEVLLAKVDIDENTELALDFDVGSVPVLVAIKNGKVKERLVGLQDTDKLRQFVEKVVSK